MMEEEQCCLICEARVREGIVLLGHTICADCEQEMIHTEVDDELYAYFVEKLRTLWFELTMRPETGTP
ncbi:sigma factor G inhibitor Gin [Ferroacidibacillus organovorans]|uniref:Inhibitor of sigma-G Gin n=2 Tax=Ferroacidibacillus organovorans TaxID=1765683 RepID=A0A1V4EVK3_9BACL|nr:sigma factor G inhibitor Gin [Ferroacidibacillus organovorans]OPG16870.1 hypothetical protein B2M26_04510 [Ferroacidibacillus organovorans]